MRRLIPRLIPRGTALLAVPVLLGPAVVLNRRRRRPALRTARPGPARDRGPGLPVARKASIILADHERLVVGYSARDNAVYVLTPPGQDPRAALPAARLVLHDDAYQELASYLGGG